MADQGEGKGLKRSYTTLHYLIHAPNFIRLFWRLMRDPRVSFLPKLILAAGIGYFVFPFDSFPDFPLVGLGWLDDILVLVIAAKVFIWLCPKNVVREHVQLIDDGG